MILLWNASMHGVVVLNELMLFSRRSVDGIQPGRNSASPDDKHAMDVGQYKLAGLVF
jgi:hypothetical protein